MQNFRSHLLPAFIVATLLTGSPIVGEYPGRSVQAQTRTPAAQRNQAAVPIIKLRDRTDIQAASSASHPTQLPIERQASSGSWPGPPAAEQAPSRSTFTSRNGFASDASPIQQVSAQSSYAFPPTGPVLHGSNRKRIRDYSWIYIEPPVPPEIKLHDIVTIIVDEKSEVIMNSKFNRQRTSRLLAELKEFVRIGDTGNLTPAALNGPTIDAQLQGQLNSTGQLTDKEGIKYRIAATVVDVLPNGVLQLEAKKKIKTQDDVSEYTLTGELRASDVAPDNTASSENIASLHIVKNQGGRVYDATKRNWGYRLYDLLSPF
jgi:flagellar L-ring protein FlgH